MSLFDQLGMQMNPQQMLQQIKSNPAAVLRQKGLNIPDGMTNPQQIIQHLISSGQVPQSRHMQAMQMMGRR